MAQQNQDVDISYDSQGNIIVDRYAKALDILDGDNPYCWKYERHVIDTVGVHYAILLGDVDLDVKGTQMLTDLTPNINYNVFIQLELDNDGQGFDHPLKLELTDQNRNTKSSTFTLKAGDNIVPVGMFCSSNSGEVPFVSVRFYDTETTNKTGLTVRRVNFTPRT